MNKTMSFKQIPIPEFLPIILRCTQRGDEALYYLLTDRMESRLYSKYIKYKEMLDEDFSEMLDSFYLYLHDHHPKKSVLQRPYQLLLSIRQPSCFGAWLVKTFNYFLSNQAKATIMTLNHFDLSVLKDEQHMVTDSVAEWERKYCFVASGNTVRWTCTFYGKIDSVIDYTYTIKNGIITMVSKNGTQTAYYNRNGNRVTIGEITYIKQ